MKILIADDHRLVIEAVKAKLSELEAGIDFVLAMSVDELLASASDDLDLAVIDLNMPGAEGQAHIDEVRRRLRCRRRHQAAGTTASSAARGRPRPEPGAPPTASPRASRPWE